MNSRMLMAIGITIALISALVTFVGTFASASLSNLTINEPPGNTTDDQGGLSPQDESGLAIACDLNPEGC
jgi:hypothetical protein